MLGLEVKAERLAGRSELLAGRSELLAGRSELLECGLRERVFAGGE